MANVEIHQAMSEAHLKAFLERLAKDPKLQDLLKQEGADPIAIAKDVGFDLRPADLIRYQSRRNLELADDELEQIAGGDGWLSIGCPTYGGECKKTDQCYVFSCNF